MTYVDPPRYHAPECGNGNPCQCGYAALEAENERLKGERDEAEGRAVQGWRNQNERIRALEEEIEQHKTRFLNAYALVQKRDEDLEAAEQSNAELRAELDEYKAIGVGAMGVRLGEQALQIERLQRLNKSFEEAANEAESEGDKWKRDAESYRLQFAALKTQNAELRAELEAARRNYRRLRRDYNDMVKANESELTTLKTQVETLPTLFDVDTLLRQIDNADSIGKKDNALDAAKWLAEKLRAALASLQAQDNAC